jgi:hypothetical protein
MEGLALAHVEAAVRGHLLSAGRTTVDDATINSVTSIVMRGLTPLTLAHIASSGLNNTELIQALIPRSTQPGVLPPFNWSSITPAQIEALRAAGLLRGDYDYRRALALAMRGGGGSGSREYNTVLGGDLNTITRHTYAGSPYDLAGVHFATFDYLRGQGFNHQHIMNAAQDAENLGFRGNHGAIHDHAIIDRHSIDARGMNAALLEYQRRTREDAELRTLLEQRRQATTQAEQDRLDALIQARRLEHERASGLYDRLHNPEENESARGAGGRRKDAIDQQQDALERTLELNSGLAAERLVDLHGQTGGTELVRPWISELAQHQGRTDQADDALLASMGGPTPTVTAPLAQPAPSTIQSADAAPTRPTQGARIAQTRPPSGPTLQG